ncbi:MAG: acyl-CoA thioesterase [Methyloligellaceae bacterium]
MNDQNKEQMNLSDGETVSGQLELKTFAMPKDTNANGDIFGGWVLSQMDLAAGVTAREKARGRVATIAIDAMKFVRPVRVGDLLCVYCSIVKIGNTSVRISVEAWVERYQYGVRKKVTEGIFTFVAIDEEGRPRPIPTA